MESERSLLEKLSARDVLRERGLLCEDLGTFEDPKILTPEVLGVCLQEADKEVVLWVDENTAEASHAYMEMLDVSDDRYEIVVSDQPVDEIQESQKDDAINLAVTSAIDKNLKDSMFTNPDLGQLFADGIYLEEEGFESPLLYCVGITAKSLNEMKIPEEFNAEELAKARSIAQKQFLRKDQLTSWEFRQILKSDQVKIIAHGLGPEGTNISQALRKWAEAIGIDINDKEKIKIMIHDESIEPLAYADIATDEIEEGVIPVHMECAVYYGEKELYETRGEQELVFADHYYMPLDRMMVVGNKDLNYLLEKKEIIIATHPSPRSLVSKWEELNHATWIKATSNSAAVGMVARGEADLCITTSKSLETLVETKAELEIIHECGSPMMAFTIATPLSNKQLREYLS